MSKLQPRRVRGFVVVDGPIGAGKTTLIQHLKEELIERGAKVTVIEEVIPEDLDAYYKDPAKESYNFQTRFISILADQMYKACKAVESGSMDYVISDRYYASTRAFIEYQRFRGFLTDEQVDKLYAKIRAVFKAIPIVPEFFIYVDEPSDICVERILKRGREGELNAQRETLISTNDFIGRFNSVPYFGSGDDRYVTEEAFGRLAKHLPAPGVVERVVGDVNMVRIYAIEEGTTRGIVLPQREKISLSEVLAHGRSFHSLHDQIARDILLVITSEQNPDHLYVEEN